MRWLSVITSEDLGLNRGTPERLEALIRQLPKDLVVVKALQCAAALGVDKKASYMNVDGFLLRSAPAALLDRIQAAKAKQPDATFIFFEPWQQLLLARHAQRIGGTADAIVPLDSREGLELLFNAYPMGFFAKNVDGRIDDPNAGWKGKALWSTYGTRTMYHLEGGKENRPKAVKIQLRPSPLAR